MKIQEILNEITTLLQEKDLSCTPRFRELAKAYGEACAALELELADCRELLRKQDTDRAVARNRQASPPLTERARMLQFPGLTQYQELCRLYGLDVPQEFDMDLVLELERADAQSGDENRDDLLAQYRTLARTGTRHEKVLLLRKMLRIMPDDPVWKKNLATAERAWIVELQKEARTARKLRDLRHLFSVYSQLTSAELSQPVPESVLEPFQADVRTYLLQETERCRKDAVRQISEAYSLEDLPSLEFALNRYDEIAESSYCREQHEDRMQVEEARRFLKQKKEMLEQERTARSLQERLKCQLDGKAPFGELENTYRSIRLLDRFPIPAELDARYSERAEKERIESARHSHRRTIYGLLIAAVGIAAAVYAVLQVQQYRAVQRVEAEMRSLIGKQLPEKAVELQQQLFRQGKPEASAERVLALKQEAESRIAKREKETAAFARLLQEIRDNLTPQSAELPEQEMRFRTAERFSGACTLNQKAELRKLRIASADLCRKLQNDRDRAFEKKTGELAAEGRRLMQELQKKDTVSVTDLEQRIFQLEQRIASLTGGESRVSAAVKLRETQTLQDMTAMLHRTAKETGQYQKTVTALNSPHSVEEYLEALRTMSRFAPEKAPAFRAAEAQLPGVETRMQLPRKDLADPSEETLKTVHGLLLQGEPYCDDLAFVLPRPDALMKIRQSMKEFQEKILPSWDLYELILPSEQGECRFYLQDKKDAEVERSGGRIGGRYVSLIFTCLVSDRSRETVVLQLKRDTKGYTAVWHPARKRSASFPGTFGPIPQRSMEQYARGEFPKAAHHALMNRILERSQKAESIRQLREVLRNGMLECSARGDIAPAAKERIMLLLLDWYGEISELDQTLAERIKAELGLESTGDREWFSGLSGTGMEKYDRITSFFESHACKVLLLTLENTQKLYTGCFSRYPVPAGILYRRNNTLIFHPFANIPDSEEYLVFLPDTENSTRLWRLPDALIRRRALAEKGLPPPFAKLRHGEIVYVPQTLEKFSRLIGKMFPSAGEEATGRLLVFRTPESVPQEMPEP